MTRRDYVLLSDALRKARSKAKTAALVMGRDERTYVGTGVYHAAEAIADALAAKNPGGFDKARFLQDSGVIR